MADRVFVGFSPTDINSYRFMHAWKANRKIDCEFADCQLAEEIDSKNEGYIKRKVRERLRLAETFIQLIGRDTSNNYKYVRWEAEVAAIERRMRIIGVNLNGSRHADSLCPRVIWDIGAMFVSYNPAIIKYALDNFAQLKNGNWSYKDTIYKSLGL